MATYSLKVAADGILLYTDLDIVPKSENLRLGSK